MAGSTSLELITTSEQRKTAERLWQLYAHDMSEFRGYLPDGSGRYENARLLSFFADPDRCAYLAYHDQDLAGFALIRGLTGQIRVMGEFFVIRAVRRQRVGHDAAVSVMSLHPGRWAIPFQEENAGAARFWRLVGAELAATDCAEERRPIPGKPAEPPDIWLLLSTAT